MALPIRGEWDRARNRKFEGSSSSVYGWKLGKVSIESWWHWHLGWEALPTTSDDNNNHGHITAYWQSAWNAKLKPERGQPYLAHSIFIPYYLLSYTGCSFLIAVIQGDFLPVQQRLGKHLCVSGLLITCAGTSSPNSTSALSSHAFFFLFRVTVRWVGFGL